MSDEEVNEEDGSIPQSIIEDIIKDDLSLLVIASMRNEKWVRVIETLNRAALTAIGARDYPLALRHLRRALEMTSPIEGNTNEADLSVC